MQRRQNRGGCPQLFATAIHVINWKVGLTQKKRCRNATIVLSVLMKNRIDPSNFFHFSVWPLKIFEVKGGQYAKKLEFGQMKKISIHQFFKTKVCAFMTYVQFLPESTSNLRFVIRDSRVPDAGPRPRKGLEPLKLGWQISNLSYFQAEIDHRS